MHPILLQTKQKFNKNDHNLSACSTIRLEGLETSERWYPKAFLDQVVKIAFFSLLPTSQNIILPQFICIVYARHFFWSRNSPFIREI